MPRTKNEVLTIRTTADVKALLKLAAERERRSASSMVEVLVLDYARSHRLTVVNEHLKLTRFWHLKVTRL